MNTTNKKKKKKSAKKTVKRDPKDPVGMQND